ncbi:MAG: hypothetical protein ACKO13_05615, partial [Cytophagales bacterium]
MDKAKKLVSQKNTSSSFSVTYNPFRYGDKIFKFGIKCLVTATEDERFPMSDYPNLILNREITSLSK